jgi:RNA polymerase sigma factor (sigma-70 family)
MPALGGARPVVYAPGVLRRPWKTDPFPSGHGPAPGGGTEEDDETLMRRYCEGDEQAFRALFARHGGHVYGYLHHCTVSRALAEDLSQQTWLHVHRGRRSFEPGARFLPWLYAIATNLRRDRARRDRRRPEDLTADGAPPLACTEALSPAAQERAAAVRAALAEIPEDHREVIVLHRWHDLSFAEIAAVLGTTEGAVKLRAHRGYVKLRALLAERGLP